MMSNHMLINTIRQAARPLTDAPHAYDPLLDLIGDARLVLLGEASHGTHEFYHARAEITKRLITERGFTAVAVEADWPHAYQVNRFVRATGDGEVAQAALGGFRRFPQWMWRNTVVRDFVAWLHAYNNALPAATSKTGFYGLDLYSLHASIEAVVRYLEGVDPAAARRAIERYSCFEHFGLEPEAYGYATSLGTHDACEEDVVTQLIELQRAAPQYANRDGRIAEDEFFFAEQNARLAKNAEQYYRSMYRGRVSSWNLRDSHMAETLDALLAHLDRVQGGGRTKAVVWAHNSHLGDARATEMGESGEHNLGQLVRERYGEEVMLVGFSTYCGSVTAAHNWGERAEQQTVRPGLAGSYEELFHLTGLERFMLPLRGNEVLTQALHEPRLQRAIGVVYRPATERRSHYFYTHLASQFDVMLHFDTTTAVQPLERYAQTDPAELPETYPSAL